MTLGVKVTSILPGTESFLSLTHKTRKLFQPEKNSIRLALLTKYSVSFPIACKSFRLPSSSSVYIRPYDLPLDVWVGESAVQFCVVFALFVLRFGELPEFPAIVGYPDFPQQIPEHFSRFSPLLLALVVVVASNNVDQPTTKTGREETLRTQL